MHPWSGWSNNWGQSNIETEFNFTLTPINLGMTPLMLALGDPEGRYDRQIGVGNFDDRYREPPAVGKGNKKIAALLVELGAKPFTGKYRDRSGNKK